MRSIRWFKSPLQRIQQKNGINFDGPNTRRERENGQRMDRSGGTAGSFVRVAGDNHVAITNTATVRLSNGRGIKLMNVVSYINAK